MLLEFTVKNFKTFKDKMVFSMQPAPKITGLDYSILTEQVGRKKYKALSSAVVYGPNAAGKSNIISAMGVLSSIILRGNIRNRERNERAGFNRAADELELIPNLDNKHADPIEFSVSFIEQGQHFSYALQFEVGQFADEKNDMRKITHETLSINGKLVFIRTDAPEELEVIGEEISDVNRAREVLQDTELFLRFGYKMSFGKTAMNRSDMIHSWMTKKLHTLYRFNDLNVSIADTIPPDMIKPGRAFVNADLDAAMYKVSRCPHKVGYISSDDSGRAEPLLYSFLGKGLALPSEDFESYGSIRFLYIYTLVRVMLEVGGILVVDEFDASLHPMLVMSIINIFHNEKINKNNAQLIFNTHNPIFLNGNVFRRDEIKFVERDEGSYYSRLYQLSDFGTVGKKPVRKTEDYLGNYFAGKYGAMQYTDLSDLFAPPLSDIES